MAASPRGRVPEELPGWRKLPGPARRYENVNTQEIIPRRQYVDMQAKRLGWKDWAEYQRVSRLAGGLGGMRGEPALELLGPLNRAVEVGELDSDDRAKFWRNHSDIIRDVKAHPDDMSAHGPLARWLEALGIREQNATYSVGDSPRGIRQTMGR